VGALDGPSAGLDALVNVHLADYQPYHAPRADLLTRAERIDEAIAADDRAIELTSNSAEREFLSRQRQHPATNPRFPKPKGSRQIFLSVSVRPRAVHPAGVRQRIYEPVAKYGCDQDKPGGDEGTVTFQAGNETCAAGPGDVVIVPANTPHKFTNGG
jgi:hypothetical protein